LSKVNAMPPAPQTAADPAPPRRVLPVIVLAQLLGTSPWFAVNAVMPDLERAHGWGAAAVGTLSAALQLGFVAGTLVALGAWGAVQATCAGVAIAAGGDFSGVGVGGRGGHVLGLIGWRPTLM